MYDRQTITYSSVVIKTLLNNPDQNCFSMGGCISTILCSCTINRFVWLPCVNFHCKLISVFPVHKSDPTIGRKLIDKKTLSLTGQGNQTLKLKNNPYRSTPFARHTYLVCIWYSTLIRVVASPSYVPDARIGLQKMYCIKYFNIF